MTPLRSERGFALSEFLIASAISMAVIGVAVSTFADALKLNDATLALTDAGQNMRSGVNLLVRDLLQTGRGIPIGGVPIPTGSGSTSVQRPSPLGSSYAFDNTTLTTLGAVTTGNHLGATVSGRQTDLITLLLADPFKDALTINQSGGPAGPPKLNAGGSSISIGSTPDAIAWFAGNLADGIGPVAVGDLILFQGPNGAAMQTVTNATSSAITFGSGDVFNLNQPTAASGSITDLLNPAGTLQIQRVLMISYFIQEATPGEPRLMRALNMHPAQALAGAVEDMQLTYDLVDGSTNPTNVHDVPFTSGPDTFTSSQIRKVNLKIGVRSEEKSRSTGDYLRNYVTTVASLRNLAYVPVYQ